MPEAAAGRRAVLLAAAALLSSTAFARAAPASAVDSALAAATFEGAHVGVLAVDADRRTVLYARNADDDFIPASTLKLVVGSAALARLGSSFGFLTDVEAAGPVTNGTLQGDLYLRGGGDAELSLADLDAAAGAVFGAGIRRVSGALIGDASRYDAARYPSGWAVDDIPYGYAAVPSALSIDLNVAHVRVLPGAIAGAPAILQVQPQSGAFTLENATVTGARGSADTTDVVRPFDLPETIRVVGSFPLDAPLSDDLEPAVPDPPWYALDLFRRALQTHGISVDGGVRLATTPPSGRMLWSHRSKPLRLLLRDFWPPSTNLLGEQLLEELGSTTEPANAATGSGADTRARGIAQELSWLRSIGIDPRTVTIADGSGLSGYDRITPRALATILMADWNGPERETVLAALPVAGVSGTLQTTFTQTPLKGNVFAKTGSMNHARLLAGYLRTTHRRAIAFALMVNDWMDASPQAENALDGARAAALSAIARL